MIDLQAKKPIITGRNQTAPASAINTDRVLTTDAGVSGAEAAPILSQFSGTTPGNGECVPFAFNGKESGVKEIPLTRGKVALVDDSDYDLVRGYNWQAFNPGKSWYAKARIDGREQSLHRFLMGAPDGILIDHRDGDGLNCTRDNLRRANKSQNAANSDKQKPNTQSQYKGVRWAERGQRWHAYIKKDYKQIFLGSYATEIEAAQAYDRGALQYFGEFARLNFPVLT